MKHIFGILFIFTLLTSFFAHESNAAAIQLPKTGQTTCWDTAGSAIACSGTGQDGDIKAGVAWPNPRFFDNGDQTVTDNLTGLIWTKDANVMKTRDLSLYGNTTYDGAGIPTTTVPGNTWQQALDYVKKLNTESYLGHNDWRLPNINELASMVNNVQSNQATWLNAQGFTNVQSNNYWSATSRVDYTNFAWIVEMYNGSVVNDYKTSHNYVWPVRSGQSGAFGSLTLPKTGQTACYNATGSTLVCSGTGQDGELQIGTAWPTPRFTDNSLSNSTEKTVTDNLTGLVWSKDANLAATAKTWQQALDYVKSLNSVNFSGHNDWRLPNINELASIVNNGQSNQATWLNEQGFTNVQSIYYWSATSYAGGTNVAWLVDMGSGGVGYGGKTSGDYVWPVRSGQSGAFDSLTLSVTKSGTGAGTIASSTGGINCGSTCSASITTGTSVTLTAAPSSGSTFTGWSGACSGTATCTVTVNSATSVTSTFTLTVTDGTCGTSNNGTFSVAPSTNLCATGTATTITNTSSGPWKWLCNGTNGGNVDYCAANNQLAATSKCGDCNNDGMVNISEVQKTINNFLGL